MPLPFSQIPQQPALTGYSNPIDIGQIQADQSKAEMMGGLGQALMQRGYVQNSGFVGALAEMAQSMIGMKMLKDSQAKMADVYSRQAQAQSAAAKAQHEQMLQDKDYENNLGIKRDTAKETATGAARLASDPKARAFAQLSPQEQMRAAQIEAGLAPKAAGPRAPTELEAKLGTLRQLGATPDQLKSMLLGNQAQGPFGDITAAMQAGLIKPEEATTAIRDKVGVGTKSHPIPPDMAGKVALADEYLANFPKIEKAIKAGNLTGIWDASVAQQGYGESGETYRQIQAGRDALQRTLTGAGMPASEAAEYTSRYLPTKADTQESLLSKQNQLKTELGLFTKIARGDKPDAAQPPTQPSGPAPATPTQTAVNPKTGQRVGLVNGQWVPL